MYLYIFEDGSIAQSQNEPTETDLQSVEDGVLQIVTIVGGKFCEVGVDDDGDAAYTDVPECKLDSGGFHTKG